jgi:hypothetical protein
MRTALRRCRAGECRLRTARASLRHDEAVIAALVSPTRGGYLSTMTLISRGTIKGVLFSTCAVSATLAACTEVAASHGHRSRCDPPHAQTIAKDRYVRVYSLGGKASRQGGTYACLLRRGSTVALARPRQFRPDSIDHIVLAGTIVAYTDSTHGVDTGSTGIVIVNVASRRTLLTIPGVGGFVDACVISFRDVTDLVVTYRGSVAWIVRKGAHCTTATFEVHSARTSGAPALLEEGPAIVPGSLRVSGQTVSWENSGQRKSAGLS